MKHSWTIKDGRAVVARGTVEAKTAREAMGMVLEQNAEGRDADTSYSIMVGDLTSSSYGDEFVKSAEVTNWGDDEQEQLDGGHLFQPKLSDVGIDKDLTDITNRILDDTREAAKSLGRLGDAAMNCAGKFRDTYAIDENGNIADATGMDINDIITTSDGRSLRVTQIDFHSDGRRTGKCVSTTCRQDIDDMIVSSGIPRSAPYVSDVIDGIGKTLAKGLIQKTVNDMVKSMGVPPELLGHSPLDEAECEMCGNRSMHGHHTDITGKTFPKCADCGFVDTTRGRYTRPIGGTDDRIFGRALESGKKGDRIRVILNDRTLACMHYTLGAPCVINESLRLGADGLLYPPKRGHGCAGTFSGIPNA